MSEDGRMVTFFCPSKLFRNMSNTAGHGHMSRWIRDAVEMRLGDTTGEEFRPVVKTGGGYVDNSTAEDLRIFAHVQVAKELGGALGPGGAVSMVQVRRDLWKAAKDPYIDFTDQEVMDLLEQERAKGEVVAKPRKRNYGPPPDTDGFVAPGGE